MNARRVHVDTDPGLDDLLALALAFASPELSVEGITTVAGNAALPIVTDNARRFCTLAGRDVPIGVGASAPLALTPIDAAHFHGKDGRRGAPLPEVAEARLAPARDVLRHSLVSRGAEAVIALGPLTNVATLAVEDPGLFASAEVIWMGGTLGAGNVTPKAEYNAFADPRALRLLLASGVRVRMVGLEVTSRVRFDEAELAALDFGDAPRGRTLAALLRGLAAAEASLSGKSAAVLHDPSAVAAALAPADFSFAARALEVCDREGAERGRIRARGEPGGAVHYAVDVRAGEVKASFVERLARWAGRAP
ncbi:MAG TPA: nucleoside hydrolase [Myxococcota bacterium]|nr:nucleoside hydrolase [Myxococcota bacterium]